MPATRPYFVVYKGEQHIIEAPGAAHAVQHIVGADVTELRPARAAEVMQWSRANKPIPIAGEKLVPVAAAAPAETAEQGHEAPAVVAPEGWTDDVALAWLGTFVGFTKSARMAFNDAMKRGEMTLMDFDVLRTAVPAFGDAISNGDPVDDVRAQLEVQPLAMWNVLDCMQKHEAHLFAVKAADPDDAGEADRDNGGVLANQ